MGGVGAGGPISRRPLQPLDSLQRSRPEAATGRKSAGADGFHHVLAERMAATARGVKFSAHAGERLRSAGVQVDARFEERLRSAVDKAAAKGSRSSLVLLDELALVVSVRNRTVITAVDGARMKDNVFTNIDSAVIS